MWGGGGGGEEGRNGEWRLRGLLCDAGLGSGRRKPLIEGTLEHYSESRQVSSPSLNNRLQQKSTGQSRSETVLLSTSQLLPLEDYVPPSSEEDDRQTE